MSVVVTDEPFHAHGADTLLDTHICNAYLRPLNAPRDVEVHEERRDHLKCILRKSGEKGTNGEDIEQQNDVLSHRLLHDALVRNMRAMNEIVVHERHGEERGDQLPVLPIRQTVNAKREHSARERRTTRLLEDSKKEGSLGRKREVQERLQERESVLGRVGAHRHALLELVERKLNGRLTIHNRRSARSNKGEVTLIAVLQIKVEGKEHGNERAQRNLVMAENPRSLDPSLLRKKERNEDVAIEETAEDIERKGRANRRQELE